MSLRRLSVTGEHCFWKSLLAWWAGRYRIQSGSLEALWLVSSELVRRMNEHFAGDKRAGGRSSGAEEPFVMVYQEPLPLADFFGCIDEHFEVGVGVVGSPRGSSVWCVV